MEEVQHAVQSAPELTGIAKALAIGLGGAAPAIAIGLIASAAMKAIGRNPEAAPKIQLAMIIGAALAEAIAIYALITVAMIK